jgi:uncharacterized membrane protein
MQIVVNTIIIRLKNEYKLRIVFNLIHGQKNRTRKELLSLRLPNQIPLLITVILVAGKVLTHNRDRGKLSALIQS